MNVNLWKVNETIMALVASRQAVDVDRLADRAVPLDDIEAPSLGAAVIAP
jgi:hypothetical protein